MSKKISFKLSGVTDDAYHDGQLSCNYIYVASDGDDREVGETNYHEAVTTLRSKQPIVLNYISYSDLAVPEDEGIAAISAGGNQFSIYRREYEVYERYIYKGAVGVQTEQQTYIGPWEPVAVKTSESLLRDFNVTAGRSYQYVIYPNSTSEQASYANIVVPSDSDYNEYKDTGRPVETGWSEWSIVELIPTPNAVDAPILKKTYTADLSNVWLFKYSLETGSQTQNMSRSDIQTLGQYSKIGYGKGNSVSGEVSCLLGSEIVPYQGIGYIERMRSSIAAPLSTNEKTYMLQQWRKLAFSPNPKLLKDMKGQSWIVQIMSSSNTPKNFYKDQPDTISFSWKQIDTTDNVIIVGDGSQRPDPGQCGSIWYKKSSKPWR